MDQEVKPSPNSDPDDSLENSSAQSENNEILTSTPVEDLTTNPGSPKPPKKEFHIRERLKQVNLYLLLFIFIVVITSVGMVIYYFHSRNVTQDPTTISSQKLSTDTLNQLASTGTTVGDPKQVLNVASNSVFSGQVLMRSSLEVAGGLQVGGSLSLEGLTAAGTSKFDDVAISKDLSVTGSESVQGQLVVQKGLNVSGNGTFTGTVSAPQLNVTNMQLAGDLVLTRHLVAGGTTPSRSNGPALGGGGTVSVSGSDTTGTITINTGSSPAAGCFVSVSFANKFNNTPHVVVTPVGSAAASLTYYVERNSGSFSVCTTTPAQGGQNFAFDYVVLS